MRLFKKIFKFSILLFGPSLLLNFLAVHDSYRDREDILIAVSMLGVICWVYLAFWFVRGFWRFFTQPPCEDSWRFIADEPPRLANLYPGSSLGERAMWLKEKIKDFKAALGNKYNTIIFVKRKKKKLAKFEAELKALKKKYPTTEKDVREVRRLRGVKRESEYARAHTAKYGVEASKNVCPHCGEKGSVWKNTRAKSTEKTRETGLGAVIGRKTITEKDVTKLRCKNCDTEWII